MLNKVIHEKAKKNKVYLWKVAERLGICDSALSKRLRKELSDEEKREILAVIDEIAAQRERSGMEDDVNE